MTNQFNRLVALRYRDFRYYWLGEMLYTISSQMQLFAINWHIFELLRGQTFNVNLFGNEIQMGSEAFGLGLLGLARVIPVFLFALFGGVLADALDRRAVMIGTHIVSALLAGSLALLTLSDQIDIRAIYLLTALGAAAIAFDFPARQSIVANLVEARYLSNAISLNLLVMQVATIVGPAVAGILVAKFNTGLVYCANAVVFIVALSAIWQIKHRGRPANQTKIGWRSLVVGIRFTLSTRIILGTMLLDFFRHTLRIRPYHAADRRRRDPGRRRGGLWVAGNSATDRRSVGRRRLVPPRRVEEAGYHPLAQCSALRVGHGDIRRLHRFRAFVHLVRVDRCRRYGFVYHPRHHPPIVDARRATRPDDFGEYDVLHDRSPTGRIARRHPGVAVRRAFRHFQRRVGHGALDRLGRLALSVNSAL